jgi:DNA-3-methyladenine glycosylase
MNTLQTDFYNRDALIVAKELLGKTLVHETNGKRLTARIVETEAYMGIIDKAAHSYGGKRTPRVEVMYGAPGHAYIYLIYGLHHCLNVVTGADGDPQAVLIRALEPLEGLEEMALHRFKKPLDQLSKSQRKNLANGPGKLCHALAINRSLNGEDLRGKHLFIEEPDVPIGGQSYDSFQIHETTRIGIDYAEEARDYLWRFYIKGNPYISAQ